MWGSALYFGFHRNLFFFQQESGAPIGSQSLVELVMGVRREISADGWESTTIGPTLEGEQKGQATEGPTKREQLVARKGFIYICSMASLLNKSLTNQSLTFKLTSTVGNLNIKAASNWSDPANISSSEYIIASPTSIYCTRQEHVINYKRPHTVVYCILFDLQNKWPLKCISNTSGRKRQWVFFKVLLRSSQSV